MRPASYQLNQAKQVIEPDTTQISYVVQRGDSLYSVARQFDVPVKELAAYNRLSLVGDLICARCDNGLDYQICKECKEEHNLTTQEDIKKYFEKDYIVESVYKCKWCGTYTTDSLIEMGKHNKNCLSNYKVNTNCLNCKHACVKLNPPYIFNDYKNVEILKKLGYYHELSCEQHTKLIDEDILLSCDLYELSTDEYETYQSDEYKTWYKLSMQVLEEERDNEEYLSWLMTELDKFDTKEEKLDYINKLVNEEESKVS